MFPYEEVNGEYVRVKYNFYDSQGNLIGIQNAEGFFENALTQEYAKIGTIFFGYS